MNSRVSAIAAANWLLVSVLGLGAWAVGCSESSLPAADAGGQAPSEVGGTTPAPDGDLRTADGPSPTDGTSPDGSGSSGSDTGSGADVPPVEDRPEAVDADSTIRVAGDPESDWTVADTIFGRFQEHNGRDVYPGLYAEHTSNGSFEDWFESDRGSRTELLYRDEPTFNNIAFPWRPKVLSDANAGDSGKPSWQRPEGGVNGRPAQPKHFQRIINNSSEYRGGIRQRLALPDRRTMSYTVRFHVRGETSAPLRVILEKPGGQGRLAEATVPVSANWQFHRKELTLSARNPSRYSGKVGGPKDPFGEYQLSFLLEGPGQVDIDMVVLMSGDAIDGKFNPTTVDHLGKFGVTTMRWPGGNYASAYRWKDGIGPLWQRPVKPNYAWGGQESHLFGTDEYLQFTEAADLEPFINVGFNSKISPSEAADWVEYTNGDRDTPMGQWRAEQGHPEPYDVDIWQVGNETYGSYQIGHTDAEDFATRIREYAEAMNDVDSSITFIAAGIDPYYFDYGGNNWNDVLLRKAGDVIDGIDIHRYVNGWRRKSRRQELNPRVYQQMLIAFPTQFEEIIGVVRETAEMYGHDDMKINVGEWNLQPHVDRGWPRAGYPTMAHASFVAGMYNTFIRQGDAVRWAYQRDNTLYHRAYPIDTRPIGPNNYVTRLYQAPYEESDTDYNRLELETDGETFELKKMSPRMKNQNDVPYVDASGLAAADGEARYVFVTNRDLENTRTVAVAPNELPDDLRADLALVHSERPFKRQTSWNERDGFSIERRKIVADTEDRFVVEMPPASVARLQIAP